MNHLRKLGVALAAIAGIAATGAQAGVLDPAFPAGLILQLPAGGLIVTVPPLTPSPNNDPAATNPLTLNPNVDNGLLVNPKIFLNTWTPGGYIDVPFRAMNSRGTTEYVLLEMVFNQTNYFWHDYHFEIGIVGADGNLIHVPGLDFDFMERPQTHADITGFPTVDPFFALTHAGEFTLDWKALGPDMPNNNTSVFFGIIFDVPDLTAVAAQRLGVPLDRVTLRCETRDSCVVTGYEFVIRQYPTIPEPMSLALLGTGLAGIGAMRRRRAAR